MAELQARMAALTPGQTALADESTSMTWADLDHRVNQWITVLRGHGLRPGDRVAMVLGNRTVTYEVLLACLHTQGKAPRTAFACGLPECHCAAVVCWPAKQRQRAHAAPNMRTCVAAEQGILCSTGSHEQLLPAEARGAQQP